MTDKHIEGRGIFDKELINDHECYETYVIYTDEYGKKYFTMGSYIYNAESSMYDDYPDLTWRCVTEDITVPLEKIVNIYASGKRVGDLEESDTRPLDQIEDLSEKEAMDRFMKWYTSSTRLDMCRIHLNTPDGHYIGII